MNIRSYTLDTLRNLVRSLQKENRELRMLLKKQGVIISDSNIVDKQENNNHEYDEDQGGRITMPYITDDMAKMFFSLFRGRHDVYARRGGKGGYFPQCNNRWESVCPKGHGIKQSCSDCKYKDWTPLSLNTVKRHLIGSKEDGSDVIGIYPLFPDNTCRFIVFDFDDHINGNAADDYSNVNNEWHDEVDALRNICLDNEIVCIVERSRSGNGAHLWIPFNKAIKANKAREFGELLIDKGLSSVNLRSFKYYDRMFPSQDSTDALGNLIALPLQGKALSNGNSAFVDEYWNAYPDQWAVVYKSLKTRLSEEQVDLYISKWKKETAVSFRSVNDLQDRPKPWKRNLVFNKDDVTGKLHLVLADGIYVDSLNLSPRLQNQIRSLAAFDNPVYYANKRLGLSNYNNYSTVYLGRDTNGYIKIPRGLEDKLLEKCENSHIEYGIEDERDNGRPIRVLFKGDLRLQQDIAARALLSYDNGILSAATAFGKTVLSSYLISQRKVSTLILVPRKDLLDQWVEELNNFLTIDEPLPEYKTKTGRVKKRKDVIGILEGSKNTMTGIIDVAMIGSYANNIDSNENINNYGMVIIDECHHAASDTFVSVLDKIKSRYVYGVSATPKRSDKLEPITYMMIGPIRHSFTALDRAKEQCIGHYVIPRFTRIVPIGFDNNIISKAYAYISENVDRNQMIISDVEECVSKGRTPLVLTRLKSQANYLYEKLSNSADHVFILYGDNTDKVNKEIRSAMKNVPDNESLILVATGQKIGEGFNYPRLDTLMLSAPVSSENLLEQYVGRLNRDYPNKTDVTVYDYIDPHLRVFDNMYNKRLRTYRRIGFDIITDINSEKQRVNAIYKSDNYITVFERDLIEAEDSIVISCTDLVYDKVNRFIEIVSSRISSGIKVSVLVPKNDDLFDVDLDYWNSVIGILEDSGIEVLKSSSNFEKYTVIDNRIVWHGSLEFLGKEDHWDNLIRVESESIAAELLESSVE